MRRRPQQRQGEQQRSCESHLHKALDGTVTLGGSFDSVRKDNAASRPRRGRCLTCQAKRSSARFVSGEKPVERRSTWTAEGGCPHVVWGGVLTSPKILPLLSGTFRTGSEGRGRIFGEVSSHPKPRGDSRPRLSRSSDARQAFCRPQTSGASLRWAGETPAPTWSGIVHCPSVHLHDPASVRVPSKAL